MKLIGLLAALLTAAAVSLSAFAAEEPQHTFVTALTEAQTGTLLAGTEPEMPVPAGTQTKLMTVYLTAEAVAAGRFTEETALTVPPAAEHLPGATVWLRAGEQMIVRDLLKAVIIGNANDACVTLACALSGSEAALVPEMNAAAFALGMRSTQFADCTGISAENRTTAADLAQLCRALLAYDWLTPIFTAWQDDLRGGETALVTENRLVRTYEGILGLKAGHGADSGYTLALAAEQNGLRMIAVVLGCEDPDERFSAGKELLSKGFSGYTVTTPDFSAEFLQPLRVRHGTEAAVLPETGDLLAAAVPKGGTISCVTVLPAYAEAPVRRGAKLGTAAFYCGDTLLFETPLTAAADVPRRGFRETLQMLIHALF